MKKKNINKRQTKSFKSKNKTKTVKKVKKIKFKRIFFCLIFLLFLYLLSLIRINTVYIKGNNMQSDYDIIKIAKLDNHPKIINSIPYFINKRMLKNKLIKNVSSRIDYKRDIYIEVEENTPLFYNVVKKETVFKNNLRLKKKLSTRTLNNYVPNKVYDRLISQLSKLDDDVISYISEIRYIPNKTDSNLFYLLMNDKNRVQINIYNFLKLNDYLNIIAKFDKKIGILYLDSGNYFKIIDKD